MATVAEAEATALCCSNEGCGRAIGNRGNLGTHRLRCDQQTPEQRATDRERLAAGLKVVERSRKRQDAWEKLERRPPRLIRIEDWREWPAWFATEARELRMELRRKAMGGVG